MLVLMLVLLQLVDVRKPRLIDLARDGRTGEPSLSWSSRFLVTGGKYMSLLDWILQVELSLVSAILDQKWFLLVTGNTHLEFWR